MFASLLKRLSHPEPAPLDPSDSRLALGALLVRLAKADSEYSVQEITQIDEILAHRFKLNAVEAAKLRADCERLERQAPDTEDFAHTLRGCTSFEDRAAIVESLTQVMMADGLKHRSEIGVIDFARTALGLAG